MVKRTCKILIAVSTSIIFGFLNYSALSYGGLLMNSTSSSFLTPTTTAFTESPEHQSQAELCPTKKQQKQIANTPTPVLNSPPLSVTDCSN